MTEKLKNNEYEYEEKINNSEENLKISNEIISQKNDELKNIYLKYDVLESETFNLNNINTNKTHEIDMIVEK